MYNSHTIVVGTIPAQDENLEVIVSSTEQDISIRLTATGGDVNLIVSHKIAALIRKRIDDYLIKDALSKGKVK